jgi:hypothetical protein
MESVNKSRTVWLIVVIVVVLACGCLCLAVMAGAGWALFAQPARHSLGTNELRQQPFVRSFEVGAEPTLEVDARAGSIVIRPGKEGVIEVVATQKARRASTLDEMHLRTHVHGNGLTIRTLGPRARSRGNPSVDFKITVPPDTRLELNAAAGNVDVRGIVGDIRAHVDTGNVDVRAAEGVAQLGVGVGNVRYTGRPAGACAFAAGAGNVTMDLAADTDARVDLTAGIGKVDVGPRVRGLVTPRHVKGVLGSDDRGTVEAGDQADIYASCGVGNVSLTRR